MTARPNWVRSVIFCFATELVASERGRPAGVPALGMNVARPVCGGGQALREAVDSAVVIFGKLPNWGIGSASSVTRELQEVRIAD